MLIDAHQHVWRLDAPGHLWPGADMPAIHRDFGLEDFWSLAEPLGVTGTVLVQSQPNASDTQWLLDVAAADPRVLGVVGWVDLLAADAPVRIETLAADPKLRGLRPMLQDLPFDWIADPALSPAIEAIIAAGLRFDALVRPGHLPALARFAERWPELPIVIDHAAKPDIAAGAWDGWLEGISPLAALPHVHCKMSGLLTGTAADQPAGVVTPYLEQLLSLFGPERVIWGSDWPVVTLASAYADWLDLARATVRAIDPAAESSVFGGNALSFYGGFTPPDPNPS